MSTENTALDPNSEEVKTAADRMIVDRVYIPSFFRKLASYGIHPQTEADARHLLTMNQKIAASVVAEQEDPEPNPFLKAAHDRLLGVSSSQREMSERAQFEETQTMKVAVEAVSEDQELLAAALIYGHNHFS